MHKKATRILVLAIAAMASMAICGRAYAGDETGKNQETMQGEMVAPEYFIEGYFFMEMPEGINNDEIAGYSSIKDPEGNRVMRIELKPGCTLPENAIESAIPDSRVRHRAELLKEIKWWELMSSVLPTPGEDAKMRLNPGDRLPQLTAADSLGNVITPESLLGKVAVFNLWNTKCGPCVKEMPVLSAIKDENPSVEFFSVTFEDARTAIPRLIKEGFNWTPLFNDRTLAKYTAGHGFPQTIIVGRDGRIVEVVKGASPESHAKIRDTLKQLSSETAEIFFADPTIFPENGKYYLTGTRSSQPAGFVLLESDNLETWHPVEPDSMILKCGTSTFGTKGFWAPQIIHKGDSYMLTYTADEQTAVAHADNLTCHFTQTDIRPIDDSEKNIDSFLFKDDDERWYLYHVRFNRGNFLWVAEYDPAQNCILKETLTPCFKNDQKWETTNDYPADPIMEGPTVIKLDNKYYLFYSANHFMSRDYAVGYATSDSPLGPWKKNPSNPIIHRDIVGENGSGHGDVFKDNEGNLRYVYHIHNSDSAVSPRRTRIVKMKLDKNNDTGLYDITVDPATILHPKTKE